MKLRFDFTKTDNTIMSSNVVDIPTSDIIIMSDELTSSSVITNIMREKKVSKAEMLFVSPSSETNIGNLFAFTCGNDISFTDLQYLNVFIELNDDHFSGNLTIIGFYNSGLAVRKTTISTNNAPILFPLNSMPVEAYYTFTGAY